MLKSSTKYQQTRSSNILKRSLTMIKWDLLGCKDGTIFPNQKVMYHINKMNKNHMIISTVAEKAFDENPVPIYD